jgi:hypothetical protein
LIDSGIQLLNLLKNQIDITQVPFSARGSRLLLYQEVGQSHLLVKLAERLICLDPDPEAYLRRPPFIHGLGFVDEAGDLLEFTTTTSPDVLRFRTRLGDFNLAFQDNHTLAIGLPPGITAGVRFHLNPEMRIKSDSGGEIKSVRNFAYRANGETLKNKVTPADDGYSIEFLLRASDDPTITFHISSSFDLAHEPLPFSQVSAQAQERWRKWFDLAPPVAGQCGGG